MNPRLQAPELGGIMEISLLPPGVREEVDLRLVPLGRERMEAIHDGVLGEPWQGAKIFRAPDTRADISTFDGID